MITQIRRHLKGTGFKTVLWIVLIILAGGGIFIQLLQNVLEQSQWVLTVDSVTISPQQFERQVFVQNEYIRMLKEYFAQQGIPASLFDKDAQSLAKDQLIYEALLEQVLRQYPIDLSQEYFVKKLSDPSFVRSYLPDVVPLASQLRRFGLTESDFEKLIEASIKRYIFTNQVLPPSTYVPEFERTDELQAHYAPRTISYIKVPYSRYVSQENDKAVSDDVLKEFFEQEVQKGKYRIPEKRTGTLWRFDSRTFGLSIPKQRIEEYYNNHMSDFIKKRARIEVRRIVLPVEDPEKEGLIRVHAESLRTQLLKDPSQFETFAREYSQDFESAKKGGYLAPFSKGDIGDVAFEKAAFLLKNNDAISPVVKTNKGFELIQRVSRDPQVYKSLSEVKDEIRDFLLQKKFEQHFVGDASLALRGNTKEDWTDFVQSKSPQKEHLKAIESDNKIQGVKVLYELKEGRSKAYLDGQIGIVVRLDEIIPRHVQPFENIKKQIINDIRGVRAQKNLNTTLSEMEISDKTLEELAQEDAFEVVTVQLDSQNRDELQAKGIPVERMMALKSPGKVVIDWMNNDGYLMRLDAITFIDEGQLQEAEKDALYHQLYAETTSNIQRGFIASLYRDATIKINNSLLWALQ
jgi:parvulin-like peptidyl-prolyl isomerase